MYNSHVGSVLAIKSFFWTKWTKILLGQPAFLSENFVFVSTIFLYAFLFHEDRSFTSDKKVLYC